MYEDDTPPAERSAQALSLDRDLLRELLGQEELRELIDAAALAEVEASLRPFPRDSEALHDLLRLRGDLRIGEFDESHAAILEAGRRAIRVRIPGEERLAAAEDAGRSRDALGIVPPSGLPGVFLEPVPDALRSLVARWARGRGPFTSAQASAWFGVDVEEVLRGLEREEKLVRGELRPGGSEREWCDPDVLRRLRRASLAALRREVEPVEVAALGRFLPSWHGIDRRASLREALLPLQALALAVALWEAEVLPRRVPDYRPEQLDQRCASGEFVWVGAGLDRVALFFRDDAPLLGRPAGAPLPEGEAYDAIRAALAGGALFWDGLTSATELDAETALPALWDLVWSGEGTNDSWSPCRAERRARPPRPAGRARRFSRARAHRPTATQGRWSIAAELFAGAEPDRRALAELLLERHGIVTRDSVRAEGIPGGYTAVYGELRALETLGSCRRGYFVEGLGGGPVALRRGAGGPRGARGGACGAGRSRGALARAAAARGRRARAARSGRRRSGPAVRRRPPMAEARRGARGPRGGSARRPARGRAGALRRARRPVARPPAGARRGMATSCARGARRLRQAGRREAPRGRALRQRARDRDACHAAARRGRLPRGPATGCAPRLGAHP